MKVQCSRYTAEQWTEEHTHWWSREECPTLTPDAGQRPWRAGGLWMGRGKEVSLVVVGRLSSWEPTINHFRALATSKFILLVSLCIFATFVLSVRVFEYLFLCVNIFFLYLCVYLSISFYVSTFSLSFLCVSLRISFCVSAYYLFLCVNILSLSVWLSVYLSLC